MRADAEVAGGVALLVLIACSPQTRDAAPLPVERAPDVWTVPAKDSTARCADVGALRACWPDGRDAPPASVVVRPVPSIAAASRLGWRCTGSGTARTCRDRAGRVGPFVCDGARCVERFPRFPDDGEWTCADAAGAVVCAGSDSAAGVADADADTGFFCGRRRGGRARPGERVCVDLAPDFPDGSAAGWRCRYEQTGGSRKICERAPGEHVLGDACDTSRPCVDGSVCTAGHCLPRSPAPECWIDADCPATRCRFGACTNAEPAPPIGAPLGAAPGSDAACSVVLHARDPEIDRGRVRAEPAAAVRRAVTLGDALILKVDPRVVSGDLELDVAGACPVRVSRAELASGARIERDLGASIAVEAPDAPVGPDRPFSIRVAARCAVPEDVTWTEVEGAALRGAVVDQGGRRFSARTPTLDALLGTLPWGIVPVSARTQGRSVVEVRWTEGERRVRRRASITALARNRGLPSIPRGVPFVIGGTGWRVTAAPDGAAPSVTPIGAGAFAVMLGQSGRYVLADSSNRRLVLGATAYDETPLDCGRGECHASESAAASATRMTNVLATGLSGALGRYEPACAIACHATGDPGLYDGGFSDIAATLGFTFSVDSQRLDWESLPAALRRVGGVGCLACHGPGTIPEPDARWAILRTGVCATCHDAPPRYGHVAAWSSTRMARADSDPRTRAEPCARCHTTTGALSARTGRRVGTAPPAEIGGIGLGCAVCHAVHGDPPLERPDAPQRVLHGTALMRDAVVPEPLRALAGIAGAGTAVCLGCHFPDADTPWASAAALWSGRGGLDPESDRPLDGPAPHRDLSGGCLACHAGGPAGLERGTSHGFAADRAQCTLCHDALPARSDAIARAQSVLDRLAERDASLGKPVRSAPHARTQTLKTGTPLGRAAYDALLVLEDPAAADHNPVYASILLDAAENALRRR